MTETIVNQQQLLDRRTQMQAEQDSLRKQIGDWRARLSTLEETRRQALRRYDVGHDDAGPQAAAALDEIFATEAAIAKAERTLSEYPDRVHSLNLEIEKAGFRDRCKNLLALQQLERDAWHEFTQVLPEFFEAWQAFSQTRLERRALARSVTNFAGNAGLTMPPAGDFPAPDVATLGAWLDGKPVIVAEQIEGAISKAQRGMA